jgi:predicted permease
MNWWQRLWSRGRMEEQLERELRFHLDEHVADLVARGLSPREARRQAMLALGGAEQVKEQCRDARGTRWLDDGLQDVRYAARTLWKQPGFAAVVLLTLALGTGATTVVFTVVNGVLLKPLPYPEPDRLVALHEETDKATQYGNRWAFAYPNFLDCSRGSRTLAMAAWRFSVGTVSEQGKAEYVSGRQISPELFSVLGVRLQQGRAFLPDEDHPGGAPVVIIGHSLWQRIRGGSASAIGKPLVVDGKSFTIVGIAPTGFRLDGEEPDVLTPLGQDPSPSMRNRSRHPGIGAVARLRPGASLKEAQAELALVGRHLAAQYPDSNAGRTFVAEPLRPDVGDVRPTLWLLLGAVSLVLLIACANVGSLLLARAVSRQRELTMRVALGAGRGRLVRQCLTESAVLGLAGGALGIVLASLAIGPFVALWPGSLPRVENIQLDWRVLLFALAASLSSGLAFGLAPALGAPARELEQTLRAGARSVAGATRRLHSSFVVSELSLAVVLLVAAGMLGDTLVQLSSLNPGVNLKNVLVTRMALAPSVLAQPAQIRAAWQDVLDHARHVAGVESVTMVDTVPMREGNNQIGYWTTPALPAPADQPLTLATSVTPDFLKVMGIRLLRGRFFDDHDRQGAEPVAVIDEVLARQAFGREDAVGKQLFIPVSASPFQLSSEGSDPVRVVGVVGHVRYWGLASDDGARVRAQLYYPFAQVADPLLRRWSELMSIAVRTGVSPLTVVEPLRRAVRGATGGVSGDQALYEVRTLEQLVSDSLARQRFLTLVFGIFAAAALLLACIGIYGVLAYLTRQRVPEIGVRMALGASPLGLMWMVLRQSLGMILAGVGIGMLGAIAAGRLLENLVEGMRPTGPTIFAVTIPVLILAAVLASLGPARRASRVDPIRALRQE